jgi:tryptophanyl-tRNA synthetase
MDFFAPMRKRREELLADPGYVDDVLKRGAERARERAEASMDEIRKAVGLR